MSRELSAVVNRLRDATGGWVKASELIEGVWPPGEVDEPPSPESNLRYYVHVLRRMGFPIASARTRGYRYVA